MHFSVSKYAMFKWLNTCKKVEMETNSGKRELVLNRMVVASLETSLRSLGWLNKYPANLEWIESLFTMAGFICLGYNEDHMLCFVMLEILEQISIVNVIFFFLKP